MRGMIESLFKKQQEYLNHFFNHLDLQECGQVFEMMKECKGVLFLYRGR